MNPNKKLWIVLGTFILAMAIIACSCGSIPVPSFGGSSGQGPVSTSTLAPTWTAAFKAEPVPGLAATWRYQNGATIGFNCYVTWTGATYLVTACIYDDGSLDLQIQDQNWNGSVLTWTFYIPQTQYTTTFTTVNLSGNQLTVSRVGTGGTGTEVLTRVP
jgi:hypothetical protein